MKLIQNILFPHKPGSRATSCLLFLVRVSVCLAFMSHGWQKWLNFETLSATFPDPLNVGSEISLILSLFAELICPVAVILGFLYRLALIPMIFTMAMAFFVIHGGDAFAAKELAFLYFVVFTTLLLTGPGRISTDWLITRLVLKRRDDTRFSAYTHTNLDYSK
ncbi:MAG: DoxX family protein [Massilibacteroides sp.]|nr:DoxX family protein [Massilibacteroides sp.]